MYISGNTNRFASSANTSILQTLTLCGKSLMNPVNKIGSNVEHCVTPQETGTAIEKAPW